MVRLAVDRRRLTKYLNQLKKQEDAATAQQVRQHGVAFTVTVQARSNVRLSVATTQSTRRPGGAASITAILTDFGIPLTASANVTAHIDAPDGSTSTIGLVETDPGRYACTLTTPAAGVYRVLVSATGSTSRGERFTREELRTLGVWKGGDDRPPTTVNPGSNSPDLCELLKCVLSAPSLEDAAKRAGIDLNDLRRCLEKIC